MQVQARVAELPEMIVPQARELIIIIVPQARKETCNDCPTGEKTFETFDK